MNSKWHAYISFVKSGIRIVACGATIVTKSVVILAGGLLIAELLGIAEEIKDER